jgi:selenocysteine lyase/cysteine desulfurase
MSTTTEYTKKNNGLDAFAALEKSMYAALETYANVHRGSGPASTVTTRLYEKARQIVLDYLGLSARHYCVVFGSGLHSARLQSVLPDKSYYVVKSKDFGLNLGVTAMAIAKKQLIKIKTGFVGGGTTKLYGNDWVMWANFPDRLEAGTPAIINCIAFAKTLLLASEMGKEVFLNLHHNASGSVEEILFNDELENLQGEELLKKLKKMWIGHGVMVPTIDGFKPFINLDNSATTPALEPVWQTYRKALGQPEPIQKKLIHAVEQIVHKAFGAAPDQYELVFTANTTEAINLLANSLAKASKADTSPIILGSLLEHSSNDLPWRQIPGHQLIRLDVDKAGFYDLEALENNLISFNKAKLHGDKRITLVALSGASNIIGTCNNLQAIGNMVRRYGARLLVDAAQLAAHRKIDMEACHIDYLAFSGHKMYAPFGTGVLLARKGLLAFKEGEWMQIKAAGEENSAGIAALGKAIHLLQRIGFDLIAAEEHKILEQAVRGLTGIVDLKLFGIPGIDTTRLADQTAVAAFSIGNKLNSGLARNLAHQAGIGTRFGCHCAHILLKHLLGFTPLQDRIQRNVLKIVPILNLQGVLRISFGLQNTPEDVEIMLQNLPKKGRLKQEQINNYITQRSQLVYG